ncbi:MAG: glycosyltransferase family 2 protein [Candidatus Bathyarchaeota archaeon]|nr:glycosyltransferase family 2 protein [Candidatus Bathyarchaeota archaeon]
MKAKNRFDEQLILAITWLFAVMLEQFWGNFIDWLNGLTIIDFLLIFWPLILIDFTRSILKCVLLLLHALVIKFKRKKQLWEYFAPSVSIIIPAHNEEKVIERAIISALEVDYSNKEIIVVDDGSADRTYHVAYPYAQRGLIKLLRRRTASGSKAGALNYGILFASGDIIITVDADTLLERNAIREAVKHLADPQVSAVSGNVRILAGEHGGRNLLVKLQAYEYLLSLELGRRFNSLIGTLLIISGAFGAFWKSHVEHLGHYDKDTITEDFDITVKMRKLGKRLVFAESAIAWTFCPETWRDWVRQRIRWTRGQVETLRKHSDIFSKRKFDFRLVASVYDMVFTDIILLFIRFSWLLFIGICLSSAFVYALLLSVVFYIAIEFLTIITAGFLSPRKEDLKKAYLAPLIVLFYRPFYAVVRLKAYLDWLLKRQSRW